MPDVIDALKAARRNTTPPAAFDLEESIRRGQVRLRRRRVMQSGTGLALTTAVVSAALLLPGTSGSDAPEPSGEATFAIFDEPQRAEDELPPSARQHASIDESSTRMVGEYEERAYWLAKTSDGDLCLVVAEDDEWLGTSCGGGNLLVMRQGFTTAHVFPDDMELGIADHAGLLFLSGNLAISTLPESERDELAGVLEEAAEYYSAFAEPQQSSDRLPDLQYRQRNEWFADSTARYLGEYRGMQYWIGANSDYQQELNICLAAITTAGEWQTTSCRGDESGELQVPMGILSHTAGSVVKLVPDGYELTGEQSSTWERVAPNLYHDTAGS